jgi:hypothetical protein
MKKLLTLPACMAISTIAGRPAAQPTSPPSQPTINRVTVHDIVEAISTESAGFLASARTFHTSRPHPLLEDLSSEMATKLFARLSEQVTGRSAPRYLHPLPSDLFGHLQRSIRRLQPYGGFSKGRPPPSTCHRVPA